MFIILTKLRRSSGCRMAVCALYQFGHNTGTPFHSNSPSPNRFRQPAVTAVYHISSRLAGLADTNCNGTRGNHQQCLSAPFWRALRLLRSFRPVTPQRGRFRRQGKPAGSQPARNDHRHTGSGSPTAVLCGHSPGLERFLSGRIPGIRLRGKPSAADARERARLRRGLA